MLYKVARTTINIAKWFWPGVIVVFIVAYAANIAPLPRNTFVKDFSASVFGWFFLPGLNLTLTTSIGLLLLALTLAAWIITIRHKEEQHKEHTPTTVKTTTSSSHHNKGNTAQVQESSGVAMIQGGTFNAPVSIMAAPSRVES